MCGVLLLENQFQFSAKTARKNESGDRGGFGAVMNDDWSFLFDDGTSGCLLGPGQVLPLDCVFRYFEVISQDGRDGLATRDTKGVRGSWNRNCA